MPEVILGNESESQPEPKGDLEYEKAIFGKTRNSAKTRKLIGAKTYKTNKMLQLVSFEEKQ